MAAGGLEPGTLGDDLFTNSSAAAEVSENDFEKKILPFAIWQRKK